MILAIDVGNTHTVIGTLKNGEILSIVRIQTDGRATDTEFAIKLGQIFEFYGIETAELTGAILSSVVPPLTEAITRAVSLITGLECMVVGPGMKTGMNVCIDDPGTLAGDLVVGSVAAIAYYGAPVIVLDMGTASTMVVIDKKRGYLGGAIIPGVKLSYAALAAGTSLLPDISITAPKKCIATNTVDSMRSGAVFGTAALLDGMIERMEKELGEKCAVIATGGLAQCITPYCKRDIICDNDLILKGLWVLYEKNK